VTDTSPWLVVGLGNPGAKYENTRHNVGEMVVSYLAAAAAETFKSSRKARCNVVETRSDGQRMILAIPHSYMNESGGPVASLVQYYSGTAQRLIVVHDEIDLPFASLRLKFGGGDNGHNGLKSIRSSLSTGDWYRVRVGVGRGRGDTKDHVLAGFSGAERKELPDLLAQAATSVERLISVGLAQTQSEFNS